MNLLSQTSTYSTNRVSTFGPHLSHRDSVLHLHNLDNMDLCIDFALDAILAIVDANAGSIFLWDEFQKGFMLKSSRGKSREKMSHAPIKLREGVIGWVGDKGQPVLVKNIQQDSRFNTLKRNGRYRSYSFISIPLIASNKLLGIINITERESLIPFSEDDQRQAQKFAKHIAIAYEKIRFISNLQKDNEELHQNVTKLQKNLKSQEHLVSIGKLASNLAHELNNPLDAIRRYVSLALDQSMEDSLTREYLLKAKTGIRRSIRIIRGLLQFSRDTHSAIRTVEVHSLIEKTLEPIYQDPSFRQVNIAKEFCDSEAFIRDRGLPIVLQNLYRNAQQAMAGNGTLTISTFRQNGTIMLAVQDTGCGIPEDLKPHIFEAFVSTKTKGEGTGIGLAICREIVEKSGGKIAIEAIANRGTRFIISLPCHDQNHGAT